MNRLALLLLPLLAHAEPLLTYRPAVELSFHTEPGAFHQLQIRRDGRWTNVGHAIRGTGGTFTARYPAGEYRVHNPTSQWVKVWSDEFDGTSLDPARWGKEENNYGGGNNERQAYRMDEKYCFVRDGRLHIAVHRDPHTTSDGKRQAYSSARIRTLQRGDWQFGRFEIRAKMPTGEGIWPAVWMLPSTRKYGGWAAGGEIDIIESRGSAVHETTGALHFGGPWPRNVHLAHASPFPGKNAAEAFHVYALEWNAEEISWSVDGRLCRRRKRIEWFSESARQNPSAPFDQPFHLIINVAVDGRFFDGTKQRADHLPGDAFPQVLQIDYVRVFQWAP